MATKTEPKSEPEAKPAKSDKLFVAKTSFATSVKGSSEPVIVHIGDLLLEDDPLVKAHKDLWEPFDPASRAPRRHG